MYPHGQIPPPQQHFKRNAAFNDIFGRAPAPPSPVPPHPPTAQLHSPYQHPQAYHQPGPGVGRRPTTGPGAYEVGGGGRPASGQGNGSGRATSYYEQHAPQYSSYQDPYAAQYAAQGQGQGRAASLYGGSSSASGSYAPATASPSPDLGLYQGQWQGPPQGQHASPNQPQQQRHSPSYQAEQLDYQSPRQSYGSGPPTASTSAPHSYPYPTQQQRPPSQNSIHVPYAATYTPTAGHPPTLAAPPKLPEFAIADDFFGFESSRVQGDPQRDSLDSSWSGASATAVVAGAVRGDSPRSMYGGTIDEVDGFDPNGPRPSPQRASLLSRLLVSAGVGAGSCGMAESCEALGAR